MALLLVLLAGCTGLGQPVNNADSAVLSPSLDLADFPPLPAGHAASATTATYKTGNFTYDRSGNAFDNGSQLLLISGTNNLAWGEWQLNPPLQYIDTLNVGLEVVQGDEVWLAVSDYQRNTWDIHGPFIDDGSLAIDDTRNRSENGNLYVAAIAVGGAQPSVAYLETICDDGWVIVTVDSEGDVGHHSSLALVNGKPAISYYDATNGDLKYAYSSTATGSQAEDWTTTLVDNGYENDVGQYTSLAVVDGQPAISYYDETDGALRYAKRSPDWPTGSWSRVVVDTNDNGTDVGKYSSLAVVDGRPMIAYYDETNYDLRHAVSLTETGTSPEDWVTYTTHGNGETGRHCSLAEVDGSAAVSYCDKQAGDLRYKWFGNPTNVAVAEGEQYLCKASSLAVVEGMPAIGFLSGQHLMYAISSTPRGTSPDDWRIVDVDMGLYCYGVSLAVVDGRPALCYSSNDSMVEEGFIIFAWSTSATGTYTTDWEVVVAAEENDAWSIDEGLSLSEVGGKPAISYFTEDGDDLKYAFSVGR